MKNFYFQKFVLSILLFIFFSANSYSQNKKHYNLFLASDNTSFINNPELKNAVSEAVIFNINKEELLSLSENKNQEITLDIPYDQNTVARLNLKRFDVLKPDAKIVARTARGNEEVTLSDIAVSYTGQAEGLNNSLVIITFTKDNVTGLMVTQSDNYIFGAISDRNGNRTDEYILYKENDMKVKNTFHCDADENLSSELIEKMKRTINKQLTDASPTDMYVAEIAIEIDFLTYNVYGSVTNATNYALTLMAASSAIYMKEINVRFIIPYLRVWTTTDPYTATTSGGLLNQFREEWNTNQQSVQRTLAHFISRRSALGGIAWLNVLCDDPVSGYGYGFSGVDGQILHIPTYSWDAMVVSHEIGHNFGSPHTFNCNWPGGPIDSCYQVEGGCYTGPVIPIVGTIMSYCHLNGGISLVKGFGPLPRDLIRGNAEFASCMYVSQRPLIIGYPSAGVTFKTETDEHIFWGTSLLGNVNIEFSSNNGTSWQSIQTNVPAVNRQYMWTIPHMPSVLQAKFRILDSSNPGVGDTTDAFRISLTINNFTVSSPPAGTRLTVSSTNTETQKFIWERGGTEPELRYKFKIRKLGPNPIEFTVSSDNNGTDSIASVRKSLLDSMAQIMGTTGDSVRCTWKAAAYNNIDSLSSANTYLITLVRSTVGITVITSEIPDKFALGNNYPNPFNPTTNIKFDIAKATFTELKIFDSRGREVSTLVNEKLQPGNYEFDFDASNFSSGAYFYRLKTNEFTDTKRMILVK